MAELFGTAPQNITIHIKNIYEEGELFKVATCKDFLQVAREGNRNVKRNYKYYNLDVIISVGYRVKSIQGTRFRQWALQILKNHMLKGYSINRRLLESQSLPAEIIHTQQQLIEKQGSEIANIKQSVDTRLTAVEQRVDFFVNTAHSVKKLSSEVQKIKENFIDPTTYKHFLILDGQKLESDVAFTKIYSMAKKTIIIIDNYVGVKTLDLLRGIANGVSVHIFSEELDESKFLQLTESSKVSNFSKKEFEAYRNMYHKVWDHNALRRGFFKEFADDVNAKMLDVRRENAKRMIADDQLSDEKIAEYSGLSIEDIVVLRSQLEK